MKRRDRMIQLVDRALRKASDDARTARRAGENPDKPRVILACAIDDALADLAHATSISPCNHGACLGTTLDDGSWAHDDDRERARDMEANPYERYRGYCEAISPEMLKEEIVTNSKHAAERLHGFAWRYSVALDVANERGLK